MKTWNLKEAKSHFFDIVKLCGTEPQIIYDRNAPLAVIVDIGMFSQLTASRQTKRRPTVRQLLAELRHIQQTEPVEIELPPRADRFQKPTEVFDELSV